MSQKIVTLAASEVAVGHCVIINHVEQPYGRLVAVVVGIEGDKVRTKYLSNLPELREYNVNGCVNNIDEVTPVGLFGVAVMRYGAHFKCVRVGESTALYADGLVRPWQDGGVEFTYAAGVVINNAMESKQAILEAKLKSFQESSQKHVVIDQDCANSFVMRIRDREWSISCQDDELADGDVDLFQRIEDVLNRHSKEVFQ